LIREWAIEHDPYRLVGRYRRHARRLQLALDLPRGLAQLDGAAYLTEQRHPDDRDDADERCHHQQLDQREPRLT
jgi:hypothetical protein